MPVTWEAKHLARRYQNTVNNAQGHFFEDAIKAGCAYYSARGRAEIDKTPEPFRVMEKLGGGIFKGRFTAPAQPDFQGTLAGGRSIVFEAKHTTTDRLKRDVLTGEQQDTLERHAASGAVGASSQDGRGCRRMRRNREQLFLCPVGHLAGHERAFRAKVCDGGEP